MPLERQLAILMTGVLAVILATSLALTYRTLAAKSQEATRGRLSRAARLVALTATPDLTQRILALRRVASDTSIGRALEVARSGQAAPTSRRTRIAFDTARVYAAARAALASIRYAADSTLPAELWSAEGRRIAHTGEDLPIVVDGTSGHPVPRSGLSADQHSDSGGAGSLYHFRGAGHYWVAVPVLENGRRTGWVAQNRHVGGPRNASQSLRDLTGENVTLFLRNSSGGVWLAASGVTAAAPDSLPNAFEVTAAAPTIARPGVGPLVSGEAPVLGTPWTVVLESPTSAIKAQARATIVPLAALSLGLLAVGGVISWILGRRLTRPLASLTTAAEGVAAGDYARRVVPAGGGEVMRLASTFNQMASEVDIARRELERRVHDAQWAADELELANAQLLDAMVEAEHSQREAEQARTDAERANRAKSDFLAVMSHELRTPLNAIGGYAQLIELEVHGPVTAAQREALQRIARSQAHLLRLINDVLHFARIDAAQVEYAIEDVVLEDALSGIEALVAPQLRAKQLRFDYAHCDLTLTARADHDKLQQVILNLLSNAIKFTAVGGKISVSCEEIEETVRIAVEDSGVGIPADRLDVIFDPFVQVDRARQIPNEGVGLGLAISRDLARGMGGELSVESKVGVGSRFVLALERRERRKSAPPGDDGADEPALSVTAGARAVP